MVKEFFFNNKKVKSDFLKMIVKHLTKIQNNK